MSITICSVICCQAFVHSLPGGGSEGSLSDSNDCVNIMTVTEVSQGVCG